MVTSFSACTSALAACVLLVAVSAAPLAACGASDATGDERSAAADAGTDAAPDEDASDATTGCGVVAVGDETCDRCITTECCRENAVCSDEPECLALLTCSSRCKGDASCLDDCAEAHPDGLTPLSNLGGCLQEYCAASCR